MFRTKVVERFKTHILGLKAVSR